MSQEPFFIGWESEATPPIRRFVKKRAVALLLLVSIVAAVTTAMQRTLSSGTFDFGNVQEFTGLLVSKPVPMFISNAKRTFYLVGKFKHSFPADLAEKFHLQNVTLKGTLIEDDLEAMIEVVEGGVASAEGIANSSVAVYAGDQTTVRGEIVDAKCHLGMMNPGRFKPHRACAIRCIQGGIPPIMVAQDAAGNLAHYLLVGVNGEALNDQIIDYVAEPVEVSGTLKTVSDRKVLYIDVGDLKRL